LTELEDLLRERIRREGSISFRDVMQAALYHPEYGYYTNLRGFGADGDFITSPERHPAFGWLLGRQALEIWEALDRPQPFKILELGGGSGTLAESLVAALHDHIPMISYVLDEISPSLKAAQQQRLTDPLFSWQSDGTAHFIVANEVADALPVQRAVVRQGHFHELRVGLERDSFAWLEDDLPSSAIEAYFAALHFAPPEGSLVDVCLDLAEWLADIARRLDQRAAALILDYAASPPRDSLLTYYRHTMGSDPLIRLGQQDISAHVDMRTLVRLAVAQGLKAGATAQRGLLLNLGFQQVYDALPGPTNRRALTALADPQGLGGQIAAVFLLRGMEGYRPVGAVGGRDWPTPREVPSVPPDHEEADFLNQWREAFVPGADTPGAD
jgi:SAM-dependent MidA family methyltransferase